MTPDELAECLTILNVQERINKAFAQLAASGIGADELQEIARLQSQGILKIERNTL